MENIPSENETIAVKRNQRLLRKAEDSRISFFVKREWWSNGPIEFLSLFLIVVLNFLIVYPMFGGTTNNLVFSGPAIPLISKFFMLFPIPFGYSVQMTYLVLTIFFPVTFYFFVKKIGGRKLSAFISTLAISLPIYPFLSVRVENGIFGSDGSFISSFPLIFISLIALLDFLRHGVIKNLIILTLFSVLVAMFSPFGFFTYIILASITTFSEILLGDGRLKFFRFATSIVFAFLISSFWYNPGFIYWLITGEFGVEVRELIKKIIPISFFTLPILATIGYLVFDRRPNLQPLFLSIFYSVAFFIFVAIGQGVVPANPGRYIPLFGVSVGLLFGIATLNIFENNISLRKIKNIVMAGICVFMVFYSIASRNVVFRSSHEVLGAWTDIEKGNIWLARDRYGDRYFIFGYILTFFGIGGLTYLYKSSKMPI